MRKTMILGAALLACAATCSPAMAKEPSIWVKCDGVAKPEGTGVTLARIGAVVMTGALLGLPEADREAPAAIGKAGVEACTAALAAPELANFWARKVSLLQARAVHHVEANDLDSALADLRAIREAAAGHVDETWYARSAGASSQLFEAAILVKRGKLPEAEALAEKASELRPFSLTVQTLASAILSIDPAWTPAKDKVFTRRAMLSPRGIEARALMREWGDPVAAAQDWRDRAEDLSETKRRKATLPIRSGGPEQAAAQRPNALAREAVAFAQAGRVAEARAALDLLAAAQPWSPETPAKKDWEITQQAQLVALTEKAIANARTLTPIAESWLALHAGKREEAADLIQDKPLRAMPASFALLERLTAPGPQETDLVRVRQELQAERLNKFNMVDFARQLPVLEARPERTPFRSQGGFGFRNGNGFLDRDNKQGGWTIEYGARSTQPMVEELVLLRAAQVAREKKASSFVLTDRDDYTRTMVSTQYGREIARTPNGYATYIDVAFAEAGQASQEGGLQLDTEAVWRDLSSIYVYEAPTP